MSDSTVSRTDAERLPKIGQPALRAFTQAGYTRLEQFTRLRASELLKMHGVGPKAIVQLRQALAGRGWSFADE